MGCCLLTDEANEWRRLGYSANFFVLASVGNMEIGGYSLIVPKEHMLSIASLSDVRLKEFFEVKKALERLLTLEYSEPTAFEHGPRIDYEPGKSIDHAHLHVVPGLDLRRAWAGDMIIRLGSPGKYYHIENSGFDRARVLMERGTSYLYLQAGGQQLVSDQNFDRPLQYFRRMIGLEIGSNEWDWRQHPHIKTLEKTVERLRGKL